MCKSMKLNLSLNLMKAGDIKRFIFISCFLLLNLASSNAIAKDTATVKNKWFVSRNINVGVIVTLFPGSYYRDSGQKHWALGSFHTIACPYVEYFFLKHVSVIGSFVYHHTYETKSSNLASLSGVAGLRYYRNILKYKNQYSLYVGLLYGRGKTYIMPDWKLYDFHPEGIVLNYGVNFHPSKIFKRKNEKLTFDISFNQQLFLFNSKDFQSFGGAGFKYKF